MSAVKPLSQTRTLPPIEVDYTTNDAAIVLTHANILAVIGFNDAAAIASPHDSRLLIVPLEHAGEERRLEYWRVDGQVENGHDENLCWSHGGGYAFVSLRIDENEHGGIRPAAAYAYRRLLEKLEVLDCQHPLRIWNYLADINQGDGDEERYRQFTIGRSEGIGRLDCDAFPAATAIGRLDGVRELVVYALASNVSGRPIENPRQVSAYRYPRQYGPVPPSFARAMRLDTPMSSLLLISGTASVVGHVSMHERADMQAEETLRNIETLMITAAGRASAGLAPHARLKAYIRHSSDVGVVRKVLADAGLSNEHAILLRGDICRTELLLEIDGVAAL